MTRELDDVVSLGPVVENTSTFVCPDCEGRRDVFNAGGVECLEVDEPVMSRSDTEMAAALGSLGGKVMNGLGQFRKQLHANATTPEPERHATQTR